MYDNRERLTRSEKVGVTMSFSDTPIFDALVQHIGAARVPLHVPGHRQGRGLPSAFLNWLGAAAKLDLTELPTLDNLQAPRGCIAESQAWTAKHYGARSCSYSVNGSTAGICASLLACVREGEFVLMANPFHVSAWRGLILSGAIPECPAPDFNASETVNGSLSPEQIDALLSVKKFAAVYLTSPTYQGLVAPVREIAQVAHYHRVPLIVDEAHGAHFGLIPEFPEHSIAAGADVVIHSAHKMLPALTQTAWVLTQGDFVDDNRIAHFLQYMQSTSPSYLLLASLDMVQGWLRTSAPLEARKAYQAVARLRQETDGLQRDPMRYYIPTQHAADSHTLTQRLNEQGIFIEYADASGVLAVFGMSVTDRDVVRFEEVVEAWRRDFKLQPVPASKRSLRFTGKETSPRMFLLSPRECEFARTERVPIKEAVGRIAGQAITPYPPGVPIVLPGQRISESDVCMCKTILRSEQGQLLGVEPDHTLAVIVE